MCCCPGEATIKHVTGELAMGELVMGELMTGELVMGEEVRSLRCCPDVIVGDELSVMMMMSFCSEDTVDLVCGD